MKKILLIGKLNDTVNDLNEFLSKYFQVQVTSGQDSVLEGMIKIVKPDICLISLIGAYEIDTGLFVHLSDNYHEIPVLTIGTEREQAAFLKFYDDGQFENLIRPIGHEDVFSAVCRKLGVTEEEIVHPSEERDGGKKRILIVDDEPAILRSVKGMLDDEYEVVMATSGTKAITSIGKKRPDLILLDYEMPVCDGRQTLEMIRSDEEIAEIPVIFLTGMNDRKHIEAVLSLQPSGYILKPAVKERLLEEIVKALEK